MSSLENQPIETLRMDDREKRRVVEEMSLKRKQKQYQGPPRDIRVEYKTTSVTVSIVNPGGNVVHYSVLPRNLSRNGVGFLHGRFVYPNSKCSITLETLDGETMTCEGEVVRCNHISGTIHEIGVRFASPIDLTLFTQMSADEHESHTQEIERDISSGKIVDAQFGRGKILIVDGYKLDRKLYGTVLEREGYSYREAESAQEAMEQVSTNRFDLVLVDVSREPAYGLDLIDQLNGSAFKGVVLAVSVDSDDATKEAALIAGAREFLAKPISGDRLTDMVNRMLHKNSDPDAEPIVSSYNQDDSMRPLLREYVKEVREFATDLQSPEHSEDQAFIRQVCRKLIGASGSYGFDAVTTAARDTMASLDQANCDLEQVRSTVDDLLGILSRIRAE